MYRIPEKSDDDRRADAGRKRPTEQVLCRRCCVCALDDSFDEIGLVSVGLPVLVGLINAEENFDAISAQDIAHCANLKAVVEVVEAKRKFSDAATGLGTALRASRKK